MRPLHFKELRLHLLLRYGRTYRPPPPKTYSRAYFLCAVHPSLYCPHSCSHVLFCALNSTRRSSFFLLLPSCQYLSLFFLTLLLLPLLATMATLRQWCSRRKRRWWPHMNHCLSWLCQSVIHFSVKYLLTGSNGAIYNGVFIYRLNLAL